MKFKSQKVGEIMRKLVETTSPNTSILKVVKLLRDKKIGSFLIVENSKILGIFTERDVAYRVVADEIDYRTVPVSEVMTRNVVTVRESTSIEEAYMIAALRNIRHLPVVDNANRLIGIVGTKDLLAQVLEEVLPI